MASCDQEQSLHHDGKGYEDANGNTRSSASTSNNPVVKRRTIFDALYTNDILSPEEDTNDYLEDYLEKLGEYHVRRETRQINFIKQFQSGLKSENGEPKCTEIQTTEDIKSGQDLEQISQKEIIKERKCNSKIGDIETKRPVQKDFTDHSNNKPIKRSFELQQLKPYHANKRNQNAEVPSSQGASGISFSAKSKEVQNSLNVIKTLSSKNVHVDSPKQMSKRANSECRESNDKIFEPEKRPQNSNTSNMSRVDKDTNSHPKELVKGASKEESTNPQKSPQITTRILKLKSLEVDSLGVAPETSKKRHSVALKNSPKPARKGPKSKSTMHSFFEAFM